jgi:hypothetical protein
VDRQPKLEGENVIADHTSQKSIKAVVMREVHIEVFNGFLTTFKQRSVSFA